MRNQVSKEEIEEWLTSPVTLQYFKVLKNEADARRFMVGSGQCKRDTMYETGEAYIRVLTQAEVYDACAAPTVEDILEEDNEFTDNSSGA